MYARKFDKDKYPYCVAERIDFDLLVIKFFTSKEAAESYNQIANKLVRKCSDFRITRLMGNNYYNLLPL